ncbi:MAG: [FeFe] hydrogenase H-cluster maturation GTPase HydF [Clostridiales bacterium]|nr:[FeFe] hydrogenase H-cluster maturation GTPase HydF [Clostridiales bacterium]
MGFNDTPSGNRIHIGFFGRRNAGKSSLVNAVTGQELAVVSDTKGTTTDPVYKAMELLPLGPVMIIDTPGIDDEGELGELRIKKTKQVLNKTDIAVLVVDGTEGVWKEDKELMKLFEAKEVPYLVVYNKVDLGLKEEYYSKTQDEDGNTIFVSAINKKNVNELKEKIAHFVKTDDSRFQIVADLIHPMDLIVLVVPIDSSAPKGRLILPQQQVIRDILEAGAVSVVVKDTELKETLQKLGEKPYMVITDSQAFARVSKEVPEDILLTSFSILMARWKGYLDTAVKGVTALNRLQDGDRILISEGCTHHRQCEDIGTVKLPNWIRNYTGKEVQFEFCSGTEFPDDLSGYKLVVHCGACMLNEREVRYRMKCAMDQAIPFTNYGIAIAYMNGILARSIEMLPDLRKLL